MQGAHEIPGCSIRADRVEGGPRLLAQAEHSFVCRTFWSTRAVPATSREAAHMGVWHPQLTRERDGDCEEKSHR